MENKKFKRNSLLKRYEERTGIVLPIDFSFHETRIYNIWSQMMYRCKNKKNKLYGGKGIAVCDEWKDFINFYIWTEKTGYNDKLTIDRIDSNGNYEPSNCRWATYKQQNNNNSMNRKITYNGETHTVGEWGDITGIGRNLLYERIIMNHWPVKKAFSTLSEKHRKPLTEEEVKDIRKKHKEGVLSTKLSKEYNIDVSCIYNLLRGVTYKHII